MNLRRFSTLPTILTACMILSVSIGSSSAGAAPSAPAAASVPPSAGTGGSGSSSATGAGGTSASGGSSAGGPQNSNVFLRMGRPTLFVLTFATDPITTAYVSYEMSDYLRDRMNCVNRSECDNKSVPTPSTKPARYWALPEPAWTLSDYATQCENNPDETLGALILYDIENDTGTESFLLIQQTYDDMNVKALFVTCQAFAPPFALNNPSVAADTITETYNGSPPTLSPDFVPPPEPIGSAPVPTGRIGDPPASIAQTFEYKYPTPDPCMCQKGAPSKGHVPVRLPPHVEVKSQPPNPQPSTKTDTTQAAASITQTANLNLIPTMQVVWQNDKSLHGSSSQLVGTAGALLAALGAYLASHTISQTNTVTKTAPLISGTSTTQGSAAYTNTQTNNNSQLPYGLALIGSSFTPFASLNVSGANPTHILKKAASNIAQHVWEQLNDECTPDQISARIGPRGSIDSEAPLCTAIHVEK